MTQAVMQSRNARQGIDGRVVFLGAPYDLRPVEEVLASLHPVRPGMAFRYIVTPNVDHITRLARQPELLPLYDGAWQCWCDSHIVRRLGFAVGLRLPHLNGTDVIERIVAEVLRAGDRLAVIAARPEVVEALRHRYPQYEWVAHCPPMGFADDPAAFGEAVRFGATTGARFLFIGVGSPQSEQLAYAIAGTPGAQGTGFCIGAAMEFIGGIKTRAPKSMQNLGFEWLHRLLTEPRRLWRRYVLGVGPLAVLFARELVRWK
ncbi:WecB/TagA/CpsF family glycosyltransferase [Ancylobacter terrae]|uniref:WecB/TagA/CpsF family glycosyltransferase n=1 Tax=Ancylobacter sp. sgz301288 TaxID=3342077 RepID=UPI00385F437F